MTTLFRIVLVVVSLATFGVVIQKIRRSKMRLEDAVFWVLICVMVVIFALFPAVPDALSALLGIYSTANFLFLFMIFILLMKTFTMSLHISELERKIEELAQNEALRDVKPEGEKKREPKSRQAKP
ncbi:MAG TPA: DUF2304 domain-containing protein [Candidatus Avilachnospira avistercoris]|nr:DUF2304 domain-containing protein [Candidatus Avilachnospira avistercoris]